jgi:hypothetical protein
MYNAYLNINMYWDIAYSVGIQEQLPSDKTDIHLTRQSAYSHRERVKNKNVLFVHV